jgi:hypothetical protein
LIPSFRFFLAKTTHTLSLPSNQSSLSLPQRIKPVDQANAALVTLVCVLSFVILMVYFFFAAAAAAVVVVLTCSCGK